MSPGLMLGVGAMVVSSVAMGAGLGSFAAGGTRGSWYGGNRDWAIAPRSVDASATPTEAASQYHGPVVCKGCGPTLSERRMMESGDDLAGNPAMDAATARYAREAAADEAYWRRLDAQRDVGRGEDRMRDEAAGFDNAPDPRPFSGGDTQPHGHRQFSSDMLPIGSEE